jgi:hypothetical protein
MFLESFYLQIMITLRVNLSIRTMCNWMEWHHLKISLVVDLKRPERCNWTGLFYFDEINYHGLKGFMFLLFFSDCSPRKLHLSKKYCTTLNWLYEMLNALCVAGFDLYLIMVKVVASQP